MSLYKKRLSAEINEWNSTLIQSDSNTKDKLEADKSCLTESEREFIDGAPDFDAIFKSSDTFCKKMKFFINILEKKADLEVMKTNEKQAFIDTKIDEAVHTIIHEVPEND